MRFSDGSYFKVVLPLLKVWHAQVGKSFKLSDIGIEVEQSDPGVENSEKLNPFSPKKLMNNLWRLKIQYKCSENAWTKQKSNQSKVQSD